MCACRSRTHKESCDELSQFHTRKQREDLGSLHSRQEGLRSQTVCVRRVLLVFFCKEPSTEVTEVQICASSKRCTPTGQSSGTTGQRARFQQAGF